LASVAVIDAASASSILSAPLDVDDAVSASFLAVVALASAVAAVAAYEAAVFAAV